MQRRDEKEDKNKTKKGTTVTPLSIKIASVLLLFCALVALISLTYVPYASTPTSTPKLSASVVLDVVALFAFPIAYGIWLRKKWAFYASLILLESLIIVYPLTAAFSPPEFLDENWVCLLSFIAVGVITVPFLISNKSHFIETFEMAKAERQKGAKLQKLIEKLPVFNFLFVIFGVSLMIRTILPYDTVFKDTVRFASDDAIFHMRLVENALFGDHFPRRLFFDAYTYFPHGTYLHFAPLYDHIIIFASWIIGLGSPTKELMGAVGAYYPAILGALAVFPVYVIGREICNKYAGLVAAVLVAILPGQFLSRSIIGFTDHHVGEALFSTIAIMFLVLALKRAKEELSGKEIFKDSFTKSLREHLRGKNFFFLSYVAVALLFFYILPWEWGIFFSFIMFLFAPILFLSIIGSRKKPTSYLFYTLLAGMALGFYLLTWAPGLLFIFIIFVYGVVQYVINGLRGESNDYICIVLPLVFFVSLLMVTPFLRLTPYYDIKHVVSSGAGIVIFAIPLMYRYLTNKLVYRHGLGLTSEKILNAETTQPQKVKEGEYTCPFCGKKTKGAGIIDHLRIKHRGDIDSKSNLIKLKYFFDKNPELRAGLRKLGIKSKPDYFTSEKIFKYNFLLPVFAVLVLFALAIVFFPSIIGSFHVFTPSKTMLTVGEVQPMDSLKVWMMFTTSFYIAFFAMALLAISIINKNRPEELLLLVWSIIMLVTVGGLGYVGQIRFAYYYAINAAILTGFFSVKAFEFLVGEREKEEKGDTGKKKGGGRGKERTTTKTTDTRVLIFATGIMVMFVIGILKVGIESIIPMAAIVAIFFFWIHASGKKKSTEKPLTKTLAILFVIFIVFYPFPLNIAAEPFPSPSNLPLNAAFAINTAGLGIGADEEWYESLRWMRDNTPDPGVDYYGVYEEPPLNETTGGRENYKYPASAYGVMSWWDYGHMITWVAHRIPNANPFQEGAHIAAEYLIETDESEANEILDELGTRYIITDFMMVDFMGAPPHPKYVMPVWAEKNPNPWFTVEARLHFFDGCEEHVEAGAIAPLVHYRLVHESPMYVLPFEIIDVETNRLLYWNSYFGDYRRAETQAQTLHAHLFSIGAMGVEEDLNNATVPEMMKNVFKTANIPLSEHSTVTRINEGVWLINDEAQKNIYIVKKEDGKLNIFLYGVRIAGQPNIKAWTPEYIEPVSFVKTFEYVKGARIEGTAPNGSIVEILTNITTNQGREFVYSERTLSDGTYEFIVPYSTEKPVDGWTSSKGWTNFDVFASPYTIKAITNETVVQEAKQEVSEAAVMEGKTIRVDLSS